MSNVRSVALKWGPPAVGAVFLALFARSFDFVCDDAYIALRQAQNLAEHGAPVYNLGERVEVATSPLWALLLTVGLLLRVPPVPLLQGLSIASGVALVFASWAMANRLLRDRLGAQLFVLGALVTAAPVAAWSTGGLETALFAAGVTYTFARIDDLSRDGTRENATLLGLVLAATCLVRLEGMLLVAIAPVMLLRAVPRKLLLRTLAIAVAPVLALTLFRFAYYGAPLPHTFYAKTAGDTWARVGRGLDYAYFCIIELGFFLSILLCASPFASKRSAAIWTARVFAPAYIAYVVLIGGDFLDLYRFFVPIFPLLLATFTAAVGGLFDRYGASDKLRLAVGILAIFPHATRQFGLAGRAMNVSENNRATLGIEPLGWTKRAAVEWTAMGQWLRSVAEPGDTLGSGAAGAMPFYSRLPNFDLLGLGSPEVARDGIPLGNRPGHTRFATPEQIKAKAPTYLFVELTKERSVWESRGYVWVRVRGDGFSTPILVRSDRAPKLLERMDVEVLPDAPAKP